MKRRVQVSVSLTPSLRHKIEASREKSGYTLSAEMEKLLRAALNHQAGDELLLLRIDNGLLAWLRALVDGPGFWGDMQQTAVYLLRNALTELTEHDVWYAATVPALPSPIREANMASPKYQALVRAAKR